MLQLLLGERVWVKPAEAVDPVDVLAEDTSSQTIV